MWSFYIIYAYYIFIRNKIATKIADINSQLNNLAINNNIKRTSLFLEKSSYETNYIPSENAKLAISNLFEKKIVKTDYYCSICNRYFKSEHALKIHIGHNKRIDKSLIKD